MQLFIYVSVSGIRPGVNFQLPTKMGKEDAGEHLVIYAFPFSHLNSRAASSSVEWCVQVVVLQPTMMQFYDLR